LVADPVSEGIEATVPTTVRETTAALVELCAGGGELVTVVALAQEHELDKFAAWRRVRTPIDRGYVKNPEVRKGRPHGSFPKTHFPTIWRYYPTQRVWGCKVAEGLQRRVQPLIRIDKRKVPRTALMQRILKGNTRTFSWGSEDEKVDKQRSSLPHADRRNPAILAENTHEQAEERLQEGLQPLRGHKTPTSPAKLRKT
jgi:hypothetical protein